LSVALLLFVALRSFRLIFAAVLTLGVGLVATGAVAAATVGSLNLISVAFTVLYVGLGVDYAIHLGLRYRTRRADGLDNDAAVDMAVVEVGPSIALSAVTTAACFFAFLPTDFTGVSDLGLIGGNGMLVSLVVTLTVLPAMMTVFPPPNVTRAASGGLPGLGAAIGGLRRPILLFAVLATVLAAFGASRVSFDHNPLNLRDPDGESVLAYRALLSDAEARPLSVSVLRPDRAGVEAVADAVRGSPLVEATRSLFDFVPAGQDEKLGLLDSLAVALGPPTTMSGPDAVAIEDRSDTEDAVDEDVSRLVAAVERYRWRARGEARERARQLYHTLRAWDRWVDGWPERARAGQTDALEEALVGGLLDRLETLRSAAAAGKVSLDDLPADVRREWIGSGGRYRVELVPAEPLIENARLRAYVDGVRELLPDATGDAVSELETGRVAVAAFSKALALAGLATVVLLVLLQRNLRVVACVAGPLALAALWMVGLMGWLGLSFNFANVIALPLLLGVGVDNGIHMVHEARVGAAHPRDPMRASTSRAVLFATLTTMASFGNLAYATHVGMASMGRLLTVGMACVLVATLVVLPAALPRARARAGLP
ncbi:MAG: MMPL family transporter, partial [Gemmatimonadota bacterium]|nr:MMPL family transporter [Gemmatimonadota bacterium]